jgi:porin
MVAGFDGTARRGLIVFAQLSTSDRQTAVFESTLDGGMIAQGPCAARPQELSP